MKEYILCAAIYYKDGIVRQHQPKNIYSGIVICGWRHHNCIQVLNELTNSTTNHTKTTQGFLTNANRFVDRKAALTIAKKAKQLKKDSVTMKILYSEDVW